MSESATAFTLNHTYKSTDAGLIPTDWECVRLGDICRFVGGAQPDKSVFSYKEKKGFIRLIQIRDYKSDKDTVYIPENLARKKCDAQDIMIGRYGPPIFQILRGIEGAYNVALIKVIPIKTVDREFIFHFIRNEKLFSLMDTLSQRSSGQTGVDLPALRDYPVGLPPLEEQTSIAQALNDVDALLNGLEKLIAKKQAIKTASMQQLLTGKKRLPEFALHTDGEKKGQPKGMKRSEFGEIPEDWLVYTINDVVDSLSSGGTPYRGTKEFYKGNNLWITSGELKYGLINDTIEKISNDAIKKAHLKVHPPGTFLMAITGLEAAGTRGACGIVGKPATTNQSCMAIYPNKKLISNFLFHWYVYNGDELALKYCQGTKQLSYTAGLLKTLPILLPTDTNEQEAIASILSDMDEEIQKLKQRLEKTRQIKKGMMQELLTGRTRLPFKKD
ncbi:Type I restriction modification DNA specificity domain protein [Vibrio harveyi]|uniref:restriction endonuclease subunit S n=1 Tax=Vibrio harveyi TaxID=669 RepID=UPI002AD8D2D0|nr:restriction endonuclease subunit S [Vibrio harveyi]CAK6712977.1 Type I restriction modification DNA specificity domain protein [Vibrio harveyi]